MVSFLAIFAALFLFLCEVRPLLLVPARYQQHSNLAKGEWVKLICGASNQDKVSIRNLCYVYTLAGVDCVDIASDKAVITAAIEGINAAMRTSQQTGYSKARPFVMISVNDENDPHFRKAQFNPYLCPVGCHRPCERVCPANAIPTKESTPLYNVGVMEEKCYGCGRCIPVCPLGLIETRNHITDRPEIIRFLESGMIDGLEIHTSANHQIEFAKLWHDLGDIATRHLKVLSVSFPNMGAQTMPFLESLQRILMRHESWALFGGVQVWQADGRPMSGDIGRGTAHAAAALAAQLLLPTFPTPAIEEQQTCFSADGGAAHRVDRNRDERFIDFESGKHFVQLAGGTNDYSATTARQQGIIGVRGFGGFAFGGYARKRIGLHLDKLESDAPGAKIEDHSETLSLCLEFANALLRTVKSEIKQTA